MEKKNTIQKAVDYLGIYATKSDKYSDFAHIGKAIDNPLKVSYISKKKIESMLEHTGIKIVGTKEQRRKHFTSTSINKLLTNMFTDEAIKINDVAFNIDKQLRKNFGKDAQLFIEDDVAGFYSEEITDTYIYNPNGSCMSKKPISYFEIYDNFINTKAQIVGLKVGKSVIARAILWTKQSQDSGERRYFLDRIYVAKEFQNSNQEELQNKLYNKIKRALNLKKLDCYNMHHIKSIYATDKLNYFGSMSYPNFSIQIRKDAFHELENYPYMDSFRWGKETTNNISFDNDEDNQEYILEDTCGEYTEGGGTICQCCDERVHEDEIHFSECEDEYLCDDCATYIEERGDVCRSENAIYNNYSGDYHYTNDIDY